MAAALSPPPSAPPGPAPIRVLVVDDSAVVRGLTVRILESEPGIEVAGTCGNGQIAVQQIARRDVDIVVLDIEMPVMDGITALPLLLEAAPGVRVIIASTLSQRNAEISLQALAKGAADYLPKPSTGQLGGSETYRRELLRKVRALGRRRIKAPQPRPVALRIARASQPAPSASSGRGIALRPPMQAAPHAIVIGSSTGGPQALMDVLAALPPTLDLPIFIAQHMPAAFTPILAQHLAKASGRPCCEASDGMAVREGHIYLAPGDFHMEVRRTAMGLVTRLTVAPPENFCRPSVNPLLRSAAQVFGVHTLAVMLTGMGSDGLQGADALIHAGGSLIAQDEATSVVWGMPGAVAHAGLCAAVLPLARIAPEIVRLAAGGGQ